MAEEDIKTHDAINMSSWLLGKIALSQTSPSRLSLLYCNMSVEKRF